MTSIKNIDGIAYNGPPGLEALLGQAAPPYGTEIDIPVYDGSTGHFVYCYTAETTIQVGGCVQVAYDTYGGTAGYYSPMASIPDTTGAVPHLFGIATKSLAAAGGLWVQTKGRVFFARVDGATDVALGTHLTVGNGVQYLTTDHATVKTVAGFAVYEGCRHGSAGTTPWTITSASVAAGGPEFETLAAFPFYKFAETIAYNAQGNTTYGDPACVVYLPGVMATI